MTDEEVGLIGTLKGPANFEMVEMDQTQSVELIEMGQATAFERLPSSRSRSSSRSSTSEVYLVDDASRPLVENPESEREKTPSLPRLRQFVLLRLLRRLWWDVFSIYRLIFLLVVIANVFAAADIKGRKRRLFGSIVGYILDVSDMAAVNLTIAILARQDYIINILFRICRSVPHFMPLMMRRPFAKIYAYGGLHSGAAFSATLWFSALSALVVREYYTGRIWFPHIGIATGTVFAGLWAMVLTAYPRFRFLWHNVFEHIHRWAGWMCIIALWIQMVYFADHIRHQGGPESPGARLQYRVDFWCLLVSTIHVIQPWLRLRQLPVEAEHLSSHTMRLHFSEKTSNCRVYRIASSPLGEYHSFAAIPAPNRKGGSMLVSDAGDFTRRTINAPNPYYWTRGTPTMGVLCMAQLFRKVVVITTGSGVGPCLGTLVSISRKAQCRILWSAPSPRQTFGEEIYSAVLDVDPEAIIIDTWAERRRPDLVQLVYELYIESGAEAIFCISNRKLTRRLLFEMECRDIPSYGPIWDS
jgi:hypothetical protein